MGFESPHLRQFRTSSTYTKIYSVASIDSQTAEKAYSLAEQEINRGVALEFCKFEAA